MSRKIAPVNFPLFNYLLQKVSTIQQAPLNLSELSAKINLLSRKSTAAEQPGTTPIAEAIYALILHYELTYGTHKRNVALGGSLLGKTSGVNYEMDKLPMPLLQMFNLLIQEISENSCPFQIGNTPPPSNSSPLLPAQGRRN